MSERDSSKSKQAFGGDWTDEKLERVRKYLCAYTQIMKKRNFIFGYIDAFAGTGYRTAEAEETLLSEFSDAESQKFIEGSASIALKVDPPFKKYVFIEKDPARCAELEKLRTAHPGRDIKIVNEDANAHLISISAKGWKKHRAVVFLDPFGMSVEWTTLKAMADTKAIDVWILFPLGMAVNRLLKRDGQIPEAWQQRLDRLFGNNDWYTAFYKKTTEEGLFGAQEETTKVNVTGVGDYFVKRLADIFAAVAPNPLYLYNSRGSPLFMLCFAAANPTGASTAVKIAKSILED